MSLENQYPVQLAPAKMHDYNDFFRTYQFQSNGSPRDLVADGWTGWVCEWRSSPRSDTVVTLTVDHSQAAQGIINVSLSGLIVGGSSCAANGFLELLATNSNVPNGRTWFTQRTLYSAGVIQNNGGG